MSNSRPEIEPRAVQNGMSQAEYDTWMFLADKEALDEPYTYKIKQSDLTRFIAQEADKLANKRLKQELETILDTPSRDYPNPHDATYYRAVTRLFELDKGDSQ